MNQDYTLIQTFEYSKNQIKDNGTSSIGRTKAANKYNINMRDFRQLLIDVSLVEPRKQVLIVSISVINMLVCPNKVHIFSTKDSQSFINQFQQLFKQADSFDSFELKCLESLLIFVNEDFTAQLNQIERVISQTSVQTNQSILAQQRQLVTTHLNDISRAIDSLMLLMDEEDDVVALSFSNQSVMPQYQTKQIPQPPPTLTYIQEQEASSSDSSSQSNNDQLVISATSLQEFIESYLYSLHSLQIKAQFIESQIHSIFDVIQLKLGSKRNTILMFAVFMELLTTAIAITNLVGVVFGSNILNFWFADPPGPNSTGSSIDFWSLSGIFIGSGIVYSIVMWAWFKIQMRKLK
ncbi:Transmembrane_domain-containing protein [Hexamita inflata]|uniref:Transmembrane domain-containing protein n=1 Tax=Hexamita inflata TaxID=28002 RepID=A0AA86Q671_9EUKA|nr:Transmembrane domain-containing protein [Hexamita inflata]